MKTTIMAHVAQIEGNRMGDRSEMVRVTATYECANILGSLTFDIPTAESRGVYISQVLLITVTDERERS